MTLYIQSDEKRNKMKKEEEEKHSTKETKIIPNGDGIRILGGVSIIRLLETPLTFIDLFVFVKILDFMLNKTYIANSFM